jgi:hypothetical protein
MKPARQGRKQRTEGEKAMERDRRRHDTARVAEGVEDGRLAADAVVVASVPAKGENASSADPRERRPARPTTEGRR